MTIKHLGGIFGRNPEFNDVTIDGTITTSTEYLVKETFGADSLAVTASGNNLFSANTNGAMYMVFIGHSGGNAGAWCVVIGDASTPLIITQDTAGSPAYTFSISSQTLRVATASGSLTSNWKAFRVI